jgi:hypothetical protein
MSEINLKEYLTKVRKFENDIFLIKYIRNYHEYEIRESENLIEKNELDIKSCNKLKTTNSRYYFFAECKYIYNNFKINLNAFNGDNYIPFLKEYLKSRNIKVPSLCSQSYVMKTCADLAIDDLNGIINNCKVKISNSKKELPQIIESIAYAEKELQEIYNQNIIFPKYRNFLAINQISEYIDSGRCSELEGPYGAYNLFENELRQNIIISRLDNIIHELEQIRENQYYTYLAIRAAQNAIDNLKVSVTANTYIDGVRY